MTLLMTAQSNSVTLALKLSTIKLPFTLFSTVQRESLQTVLSVNTGLKAFRVFCCCEEGNIVGLGPISKRRDRGDQGSSVGNAFHLTAQIFARVEEGLWE